MHWRGQRHRTPESTSDDIWTPALMVVVVLLLTVCLGTMFILDLEQFGPQVGAIVVFKPGAADMDWWRISVAAQNNVSSDAAGGIAAGACVLSPSAMSGGGGSLVVETRHMSSPPTYRVHWAGMRTSDGNGDCGRTADLVLSRSELQKLANFAGGYGIGPKTIGP